MRNSDLLRELRALKDDLRCYEEVLQEVWARAPGRGWWAATTSTERKRIAELREDVSLRYGRVRLAVIAAHGAVPVIGNAFTTGGEAIPLAIAEPADNPWLSSALPMSRELITQTIGHYESVADTTWVERTSLVFWLTRAAPPLRWLYKEVKDFAATVVAKVIRS